MRKALLPLLAWMSCAASLTAQTTPNIGLKIIPPGTVNWAAMVNNNSQIIDAAIAHYAINPMAPGCQSTGFVYSPYVGECIPKDGRLNVMDYVPVGGSWSGDVTAVADAVFAQARTTGHSIYFPTGSVTFSHPEILYYTLEGDGAALSNIAITDGAEANFPDGTALIRACITTDDVGFPAVPAGGCPIIIRDIGFRGHAAFPNVLTGNPADIGITRATGIKIDELAYPTRIQNVSLSNFYKGIDVNTANGQVFISDTFSKSSFWNLWISNASGDVVLDKVDLAGTTFSSFGCNGTTSAGVDAGCVGLSIVNNSHMGFGPYCGRVEPGSGESGFVGVSIRDSACEYVGNRGYDVEPNTGGDHLRSVAYFQLDHSDVGFTPTGNPLQIQGNSSFPAQDYAVVLDFTNAYNSFDPTSTFSNGTTGKQGLIRHSQAPLYVQNQGAVSLWDGSAGVVFPITGPSTVNPVVGQPACFKTVTPVVTLGPC
jgi:hypothetical protein